MQIDKELINGKIDIIERNLSFLNTYKEKDEVVILSSYKDIQAIKYSLFEIVEACIDIASHIISVKGLQRAESYAEMFEVLERNDILKEPLSKNLANMARRLLYLYFFQLRNSINFINFNIFNYSWS